MNIFVVSTDPCEAARFLHDSHVVKMTLETAQLLCTALRLRGLLAVGELYKSTHPLHPCTIWTAHSRANAEWLVEHGLALASEYTWRYGKIHKSADVIRRCSARIEALPARNLTPFAQAMPDCYKDDDVVVAYRRYYAAEKMAPAGRAARWTKSTPPGWLHLPACA